MAPTAVDSVASAAYHPAKTAISTQPLHRRNATPTTASKTAVAAHRGLLSAAEVAEIRAFAATQTRPEQIQSRSHDDTRIVTYLSYERAFRRRLPEIYAKLRGVALAKHVAEGGDASQRFELRVAEHHVVTPGGGLFDPQHVDAGSLVTVDVMLDADFEGGAFRTLEDGAAVSHADVFRDPGDVVVFLSLKRHHVDRVTAGARRVLVLEFWDGPERGCPHRCERPRGACDVAVHDAVLAGAGDFGAAFFDALDPALVRDAMAALERDD